MIIAVLLSSAACKADHDRSPAGAPTSAPPLSPAPGAAPSGATPESPRATTPSLSELSPPTAEELADCPSIGAFKTVERCVELCKGAHENACYVAGLAYRDGDKVEQSAHQAFRYFTLGCQMNSGAACKEMGKIAMTGDGKYLKPSAENAATTFARARTLLEKDCSRKSAVSCSELAGMFADGLGGAPDPAAAGTYRKQACELGLATDCAK